MTDLFISLGVSCLCTILVRRFFAENGLGAFPVLTFLVIALVAYLVTVSIEKAF